MAAGNEADWHLVPRLLLRRAGFGFDLLDALTDDAVAAPAAAYRRAERDLEDIRAELLREAIPAAVTASRERSDRAVLRALSQTRAAVGRRRPIPPRPLARCPEQARARVYAAAHAAARAAETELARAVGRDAADRSLRLRKLLDAPVLDALLQLAPSFYDGVLRWLAAEATGSGRDRSMERRLCLYLQRLAAKNETTSFFGPLVHGRVDPGVHGVHFAAETRSGVVETRPFLAFWAVCELARRMAADPLVRPAIPVTRVPVSRCDAELLTLGDGRRVRLDGRQSELLAAVDGRRSARELSECTGQSPQSVAQTLARLERLGVVRTWPEPASTAVQPFEQLLADAHRFAAHTDWPVRLAALWNGVQRFAEASDHERRRAELEAVETHFSELTGAPARRAGGRMYADRLIVYLESRGDLGPVRMGTDMAAAIEAGLAPVLDIGARLGELLHQAHQELAASVLRAAGTRRMPYDEFVLRIRQAVDDGALRERLAPVGELTAALTALVAGRVRDRACELDPADLQGLGVPGARPFFAGPDLLIRQGGDGPRFVLGEVHPYVFAWGSQGLFCDDPDGLQADFRADLSPWGGEACLATVMRRRRHKGLVTEAFPGRFVEVTAIATRSAERSVAITDLVVETLQDRVVLRDTRGELVLYAGEDDHPHLMPFAPPGTARFPLVRFGDFAPRITVGEVVAQRAAWWLEPEELTGSGAQGRSSGDAGSFGAAQRARVRFGLPRWIYAHVPGEPKPLCVDLDSPLAVAALASVVSGGKPGEPVTVQEMLPEPGALWLRRGGRPVTSELRLAMIRRNS
ncbi:lantibiotic dehydratase [Streptomyces sp. NPDC086519]|uniref:lantibiotic dehydratase n=1 Tax=Streptomyces sp. NPDC086519 TaxID=3154863 RepID=UPI003417853A